MPYSINKYNGTTLATIADGTIDQSTSLKLIGKNYAGYGELQNENFLYLLENFANSSAPSKPINGQIWYDLTNRKLKFWSVTQAGQGSGSWRTTGGAEVGTGEPSGLTLGDFWWKEDTKQLFAYNGTAFTLIGPQTTSSATPTELRTTTLYEYDNVATQQVIIAYAKGQAIFIVSEAKFRLGTLNNPDLLARFDWVKLGTTLCFTKDEVDGESTGNHKFWGTASNADKLGGLPVGSFITTAGNTIFPQKVRFGNDGFTVGQPSEYIQIRIGSGNTPIIENIISGTIEFRTKVNNDTVTPLIFDGKDILPGTDNYNDLGDALQKFATVYATTFNGTATKSQSLQIIDNSNSDASARVGTAGTGTGFSIAARDGSGNLNAVRFQGVATQANYADLAEIYATDEEYEVGTVIMVGGEKEVTAAQSGNRAIGVISEKPAYLMNAEADGQAIALKGRVPVKVTGVVKKGNRLVADLNGTAIAIDHNHPDMFGIALESSDDAEVKLIEAIIL